MLGFEAATVEEVLSRITLLGELTNRHDAATDLVSTLRRRLGAVMARVPQGRAPRVLYLVDEEPYITVGPKSFLYDVLIKAGGRPFETGPTQSYPRISLEAIIAFDPEVIFFSGDSDRIPEDRIAAWQRWHRITAVRAGRLYAIPRDLLNRPGPRIISAIEYVESKLQVKNEPRGAQP
jgi:iron complex transport system substrate-binding protein